MTLPPRFYHGLKAYQESRPTRPEPIKFVGQFEGSRHTWCECPFDHTHKVQKYRLTAHVMSKCTWRPRFPKVCRYNTVHQFWDDADDGKRLLHETDCIDNPTLAIADAAFSLQVEPAPTVAPRTTPWVSNSTWDLPTPWFDSPGWSNPK
jgi:hypothetical protein